MIHLQICSNALVKVVNFNNVISLTENFAPIIIAFYIGSWSDKFGRKPFIALFIAGTFIDLIGTLLSGIFLDEINKYVWLGIALPARSITGGARTFSQMVTCFASDNSSPRFLLIITRDGHIECTELPIH